MKGKFDDIWDDMCADIEARKDPQQVLPEMVDLSKIGEQMEKAALDAFKKAADTAASDAEEVNKLSDPDPEPDDIETDDKEKEEEDL